MSANIFGERFVTYRQPAWHQIGTVFETPVKAIEACKMARLDFQVNKVPLTASYSTLFGQAIVETGLFGLVREPLDGELEPAFFGTCGANYEVLQNEELAKLLDVLTDEWGVETAGALGNGETTFYVLRVPGVVNVAGDDIEQYFLASDTKDGKTALRIAFTPVRVVCQNTLVLGWKQATVRASLAHIDTANEVGFRMNLLKQLQGAMTGSIEILRKMATRVLTGNEIEACLRIAYPEPTKPGKVELQEELGVDAESLLGEHFEQMQSITSTWKYYCNLAATRRMQVQDRLNVFNDESPQAANTAWALYNAVVENEDYRDGPETMYKSTLFGARALVKRRTSDYLASLPTNKPGRPRKAG